MYVDRLLSPHVNRSRSFALGMFVLSLCSLQLSAQQADSAKSAVRPRTDSTLARPRVTPTRRPVVRDSLSPPVSPGKAFLFSLALPGLGQSKLNRPTAGAVYFTAEAVWLTMLAKSANDLRIAKAFANEVVVSSYAVDPTTGKPLIVGGKYVVKDTLRSTYADPVSKANDGAQQRSRIKARKLHLEDWIAMLAFNHLFSGADAFVSAHLWDLPAQVDMRALPRGTGIGVTFRFR